MAEGGQRLRGATVALLRVSRACGVAPVTFERQRSLRIVRVSRKYAFISCTFLLLLALMTSSALLFDVKIEMNKDALPAHAVTNFTLKSFNTVLVNMVLVLAAVGARDRVRRFMSYYTRIHQFWLVIGAQPRIFHDALKQNDRSGWCIEIHISIEDKPMSRVVDQVLITLLAIALSLVFTECIANIVVTTYISLSSEKNMIVRIMYKSLNVAHIVCSLWTLQITFVIVLALWTLKSLNNSIASLQARVRRTGLGRDESAAMVDMIRHFTDIYATISDVCGQINATEGFAMLLILVAYIFGILTFAFHTKLATNTTDPSSWLYAKVAVHVLHYVQVCFHVAILVEPCHRTHGELKRTQLLISRLLCAPASALDSVSVELVRFYEITEPCIQVYTPLGTFGFSRSLYTGLIGGLTTLFVIVTNI